MHNFLHRMFIVFVCLFIVNISYAYKIVSGDVSGQTWIADSTYIVTGNITVNDNTTLTINSGTVIKFYPNTTLTVRGTIVANGSSGSNIVFTSRDDNSFGETSPLSDGSPAPGDWYGIFVDGNGTYDGVGNFNYTRLRYGGNTASTFDANLRMSHWESTGYFNNGVSEESGFYGLSVNSSNFQVSNTTSQNNTNTGLYSNSSNLSIAGSSFIGNGNHGVHTSATSVSLLNNTFTGNTAYGGYSTTSSLTAFNGNNGSGNGTNGFGFYGNVTVSQTWNSGVDGFHLILTGLLYVNDNITLNIDPLSIIKGTGTGELHVRGTVKANGTNLDSMVIFTSLNDDEYGGDTNGDASGSSPAPGDWYGIFVDGNGTYDGVGNFNYTRLRYGGHIDGPGDANLRMSHGESSGYFRGGISEKSSIAGISLGTSSFDIRRSRIIENAGYGISISSGYIPNLGTNNINDKGSNSIRDNNSGSYQLYNGGGGTINAYYNYWGVTDSAAIDAIIYDNDENGSFGPVLFEPFLLTDPNLNDPPEIISVVPALQWLEDDSLEYSQSNWYDSVTDLNDPDSALTYSLIPGKHVNSIKLDSIFTIFGDQNWFGTDTMILVVSDWEYSDSTELFITIYPVNDAPVLSAIPDVAFNENDSTMIDLDDYLSDVDTDTSDIILTADILDASNNKTIKYEKSTFSLKIGTDDLVISIDSLTHVASFSSSMDSSGVFTVVFIATDDSSASGTDTILVTINPDNYAPDAGILLTPADGDTLEGLSAIVFEWQPGFDIDADTLYYALHVFGGDFDSTFAMTTDTTSEFNGVDILSDNSTYSWSVSVTDKEYTTAYADTFTFITPFPTSIYDGLSGIPGSYALRQNYPNPFNPVTTIRYDIPTAGKVKLTIFNVLGQRVVTLFNEQKPAGYHTVQFKADNYASGLYYYLIEAGHFKQVKKMMLIK